MSTGELRPEDLPGLPDEELQALELNIYMDGGLKEGCPRRALRDAATDELHKRGLHSCAR